MQTYLCVETLGKVANFTRRSFATFFQEGEREVFSNLVPLSFSEIDNFHTWQSYAYIAFDSFYVLKILMQATWILYIQLLNFTSWIKKESFCSLYIQPFSFVTDAVSSGCINVFPARHSLAPGYSKVIWIRFGSWTRRQERYMWFHFETRNINFFIREKSSLHTSTPLQPFC